MAISDSSPTTLSLPDPTTARAVYLQLLPQIKAVDTSNLAPRNLDVSVAVRLALSALPILEQLKPQMDLLPAAVFDHTKIARVKHSAFAAWYAHLVRVRQTQPKAYAEDLEEAKTLRKSLLSDAEALATRNRMNPARVAEIRAGQGNVDVANDLVALAAAFEAVWDDVHDKTAATEDELQRAEELGANLIVALALDEAPQSLDQPADLSAQAFTLFYNDYEECRRGVYFLRYYQTDRDQLFPSLFSGRRQRGKKRSEKPQGAADTTAVA